MGIHLAPKSILNIDRINLASGHDYKLVTDDGNVAAGRTLTVDGSALSASDILIFNGIQETDGSFTIKGGAGDDTVQGGLGNDSFFLDSWRHRCGDSAMAARTGSDWSVVHAG